MSITKERRDAIRVIAAGQIGADSMPIRPYTVLTLLDALDAADSEALSGMEEIARLRAELDAAEAMAEAAADIVECMDDAGLSGANLDLVPLRNALHRFKREAPATDAAEAKMGEPVAWRYRYNKNWNIANIGLEWSPWKLMAHEPSALDAEFEIEPLYLYAAPPDAEPVKVEPLEFDWAGEQCTVRYAASRGFWVGYRIGLRADGRKALHIERIGNEDRIGDYAEWEEAEAAAQADYEARIRSALISPAP